MVRGAMLTAAALTVPLLAVTSSAGADDPPFPSTSTSREMVVTANPLATEAAEHVLQAGGTAADAMIAAEVDVDAHHLSGRFHLGAENDVAAGEFPKGEDGHLDREVLRLREFVDLEVGQFFPGHDLGRHLGKGHAHCLGD